MSRHPAHVFGYGSLVNDETHSFAPVVPARLTGWQRVWGHKVLTPDKAVTSLSIRRRAGSVVDGAIAHVPALDWAGLDQREAGYDRIPLGVSDLQFPVQAPDLKGDVITYETRGDVAADGEFPILQSYIDAVMMGFYRLGGIKAASAFVTTTAGWETPIRNDRDAPLYPRAVALSDRDRAMIDALLSGVR